MIHDISDLTAGSMKITAFWDIVPCSLSTYCLHHQDDRLMMEAVLTSEM
jgi:hypothetical protein